MIIIKTIKFYEHKIFENQNFDFFKCDNGVSNSIIFAGENGSGKTKLLLENSYGKIVNIYNTQIPTAIKAAEASSQGKSIFTYDKNNKCSLAYYKSLFICSQNFFTL